MKRALLAVIILGACGGSKSPATSTVTQQTPPALAGGDAFDPPKPTLRLPRHFLPSHVTARVAADPAKPEFAGEVAIDGELDKRAAVIWLHAKDLKISDASATDGKRTVPLHAKLVDDLVSLRPDQPLDPGHWTVKLVYTGKVFEGGHGLFASKYGADTYLATQFEALSAREVFPMIDEPDLKIPWQLTIDAPKGATTVSNTPEQGRTALDAGHERIAFKETRPLPSYLVAFAMGPYEILDAGKATKSGVPIRIVTPRGTAKKAEYVRTSYVKIVDSLEAWFQIPYPYPKLDLVVVPEMQGAMENAGMITSLASAILFDKPFAQEKYQLVSLIGHETAHQWFGDLVTCAWWDDIWLNESFATWMEDKVLLSFDKSWPSEVAEHRDEAMGADEVVSARKIRQPITSEADMHNAFDSITYPKGKTILRMIEHQMGETAFQTTIQRYLKAHADGNAKAEDLFAAFDETAGKPLGKLVTSYFDQAGLPEVAIDATCDGGGHAKVSLSQQRYLPNAKPDDQIWTIPVCVAFDGAKGERLEQCTVLTQQSTELELPNCPNWYTTAGDYGYFRTRQDEKSLVGLRDKGWAKLTPEERIRTYENVSTYAMQSKLPLALWWSYGQKLSADKNDRELAAGLGVPGELTRTLSPNELESVRAKVRKQVEPMAKSYSLLISPDEPVDKAHAHGAVVGALMTARSHVYDAEAKKLFPKLDELPLAQRGTVAHLAIAADPKLALTLKDKLDKEPDPGTRNMLLFSMLSARDKAIHRQIMEALVDDKTLTPLESAEMWFVEDPEVRADNEAYVREHWDALAQKLPIEGEFPLRMVLMAPFLSACDPEHRDDQVNYIKAKFKDFATVQRPLAQNIERNDTCIARKKQLEPAVRAWLGTK